MGWEDVAGRARGLSARLMTPGERSDLARTRSLEELAQALRDRGYQLPAGLLGPAQLDRSIRAKVGERQALLRRWAGPRRSAPFAVVFEEDDIRAIRSFIRGSVEGASPETRLSGLVPTPHLSGRALEMLAEQPSPAAVLTLLTIWGHPYAPPLRRLTGSLPSNPARLEDALLRTYVRRATDAAPPSLRDVRDYVRRTVDLTNARKVLWSAFRPAGGEMPPFTHGGRLLTERIYGRSLAAADRSETVDTMVAAFSATPYAHALSTGGKHPDLLEGELLAARERELSRRSYIEPLGPAPILKYLVALRMEALALTSMAWGIAMGAPAERLATAAGVQTGEEGGAPMTRSGA